MRGARCSGALLAALALVLTPGAAQAQRGRQPAWDCDIAVREGNQSWDVDHISARWTFSSENGATLTLSVLTFDPHYKHHFITDGALSEWANAHLVVSPRTMRAKGKLWASIATQGKSLPGQRVRTSNGFYSVAIVRVYDLMPDLAEGQSVTVSFYDKRAVEADRIEVPMAMVRSAADRLVTLMGEYDRRIAAPNEEVCEDTSQKITILSAP